MFRFVMALAIVIPVAASAQTAHQHAAGAHDGHSNKAGASSMKPPSLAGQDAFAAVQEIVAILEADPKTDWSKVNIEALRQHLIDMNNVTLAADVRAEPIENGVRFAVTGVGRVTQSIRRMVAAHAATMDGAGAWHFRSEEIDGGAMMAVTVPKADVPKLVGLGFIGVMSRGMHHQQHHLMIARGGAPHH